MANKKTMKKQIDKITQDELDFLVYQNEAFQKALALKHNLITILEGQVEALQKTNFEMKRFLGWDKHHEA
tara:strand:- start:1418 stop:1627 length:210 start_codon:yes stop_codon:yes gene_type:complete